MKYKGKEIKGRNREIIPIPREGGDVIFIANAVQDWSEFEKMVAEPKPPKIIKPGGVTVEDKKDPAFIKLMDEYATQRTDYLILSSIAGSPGVEWETVDMNKPTTWKNYKKELFDSGFTEIEVGQIMVGVMKANSLDEAMLDEARANFLHGSQGSEEST